MPMRPMLAEKSERSWPLLQAVATAFHVSAGDGTTTAPLERAEAQSHTASTPAIPAPASPTRHGSGSSARRRRTGAWRRPRPAGFTRAGRRGGTTAATAATASSAPVKLVSSATMGLEVLLGERRVVEAFERRPLLDEARPHEEVVDLPEHRREVGGVLPGVALDGVGRAEELGAVGQGGVVGRAQLGVLGHDGGGL